MLSGGSNGGSPPPDAGDQHTYVNTEIIPGFTVILPSPIGNLPLDLFITIIHLVLDVEWLSRARNDLQNLRLVSKRWCRVLESAPFFWTTIHSDAPSNWITASVERSKSLPLTVRCTLSHPAAILDTSTSYTNLTTLLVSQSQRWKKLSVVFQCRRPITNPLPFLQAYDAPNLESLTLSGRGVDTAPWNGFGGHPPGFRRVYLKYYSIPWTSAILHSGTLQYLYLVKLVGKMPTSAEIRNILINSPRLRVLEVGGGATRSSVDTSTTGLASHPIALPELTRLCLDVESHTLYHILPRLLIPACSRLKVGMGRFFFSPEVDTNGVLQHLASRLHSLAGNLVVTATSHKKYCITGRSGRMDLNPIVGPVVLTGLLNVYEVQKSGLEVHPLPTTTLVLSASGSSALAMFCETGDALSKSIDRIVIRSRLAVAQANLGYLSVKSAGDTSSLAEWPFPNLVGVELTYYPEMAADILAFVEARCNGATGQAVRLRLSSREHRPDEQVQELIRTHELVDFEWK